MTDPIKQRIQELCPEILQLKFGCEVMYRYENDDIVPMTFFGQFGDDIVLGDEEFGNLVMDAIREDITEILGSPITIPIVLRAIALSLMVNTEKWERSVIELVELYDLTKDYDGQTQETRDFIGSLLK